MQTKHIHNKTVIISLDYWASNFATSTTGGTRPSSRGTWRIFSIKGNKKIKKTHYTIKILFTTILIKIRFHSESACRCKWNWTLISINGNTCVYYVYYFMWKKLLWKRSVTHEISEMWLKTRFPVMFCVDIRPRSCYIEWVESSEWRWNEKVQKHWSRGFKRGI